MTNLDVRMPDLVERMDEPDCDLRRLERTYRAFRHVNAVVAGWRGIYRERLRPVLGALGRPATLLDIGFGGGDVPRRIAAWADRDRIPLEVTAIDPDPRAFAFASSRPDAGVRFRRTSTSELLDEGARFDIVVSNHVLHHVDDLPRFLADSRRLATAIVVHNDIERSRAAYAAYAVAAIPIAAGTFVREDGLLSIRRSYRREELAAASGNGWRVETRPISRVLLVHEAGGSRDPGMPR